MKKWFLSMGVALFLMAIFGYANHVNQNLSDHVLRMHIIANSNSPEDQALKLEVRDEIIHQLNLILPKNSDKKRTTATVLRHSDLLLSSAKNVLQKKGCNDSVSFVYGKSYFPLKSYSDLSFPSGEYDSFQIRIGKGEGENWWCVMYPSFGAPAEEVLEDETINLIKEQLSLEEYELITSDKPTVIFRFKTVDYLMKIKEKFKSIGSEL